MSNSFLPNCSYSIRLLDKLTLLDAKNILDFPMIKKAISFAKKYHDRQFRKSGEPFYSHPLEVAYMVSDYSMTTNIIVTSILHDVVEDSEATAGMILDEFSWRIAEMVDMLTRDRPDGTKLSVGTILNNAYEKNDKEVLLIKCIDRLHSLQTIASMRPHKQMSNFQEAIDNFFAYTIYLDDFELENTFQTLCLSFFKQQRVEQTHDSFYKDEILSLFPSSQNDLQPTLSQHL
jgi:guanosine-3',5'-bis(diphosphate) 3'-pyrophosphohydrolase